MESMSRARTDIPKDRIAEFCRRNRSRCLALFGSAFCDDFRPEGDMDVLVEFEPDARVGLRFFALEDEIAEILGRKVDLNPPCGFLSDYFRDEVRAEAETQYDAA
jgi:predicted nucleotidyltransferase